MELRDKVGNSIVLAEGDATMRGVDIGSPLWGRMLADAAIATVQEAGWQDIATAPNGEWVLIYRHAPKTQWHGRTEVAQYTPRSNWGSFNRHFPPTHWMPLPPPPFEGTKHD